MSSAQVFMMGVTTLGFMASGWTLGDVFNRAIDADDGIPSRVPRTYPAIWIATLVLTALTMVTP